MEPVGIGRTHILVLHYSARDLLEECLPSVAEAARRAPLPCAVTVVDNGPAGGLAEWLAARHPGVGHRREANRGLASFNAVLADLDEPAVLLLNDDVKLDAGAVGPLLRAIEEHPDALFSAPRCWAFDGATYEGMRTRVRTRFGLVQGRARTPDHAEWIDRGDQTAAAGPVLAVNRERFLALGGYDDLYFPGRIEDLDLGFRGWMAGWRGYYVPEALAYHRGFGSFDPACDALALRNTLLFAWKNLAGMRLAAHLGWLPVRLAQAAARGRLGVFVAAARRLPAVRRRRRELAVGRGDWNRRQEAFFRRFAW